LILSLIIRKYHDLQLNEDRGNVNPNIRYSKGASENDGTQKNQKEHAIPVACLLNLIFYSFENNEISDSSMIQNLIENNTFLVWVTQFEHLKLNEKYAHSMPDGFDTYPWKNVWARYEKVGIKLQEKPRSTKNR
jgi:hypothetical protein